MGRTYLQPSPRQIPTEAYSAGNFSIAAFMQMARKMSFRHRCGAGAKFTNCGSDSLPFNQRLEEILKKKVMVASMRYLVKLSVIKKKSEGRKNVYVGAGAGAVIRIYGSAESYLFSFFFLS